MCLFAYFLLFCCYCCLCFLYEIKKNKGVLKSLHGAKGPLPSPARLGGKGSPIPKAKHRMPQPKGGWVGLMGGTASPALQVPPQHHEASPALHSWVGSSHDLAGWACRSQTNQCLPFERKWLCRNIKPQTNSNRMLLSLAA